MTVFHARPLALGIVCYLTGMAVLLITEAHTPILATALTLFVLFAILAVIAKIKTADRAFTSLVLLSFAFLLLFCRGLWFCQSTLFPIRALQGKEWTGGATVTAASLDSFQLETEFGLRAQVRDQLTGFENRRPQAGDCIRVRLRIDEQFSDPEYSLRGRGILATGALMHAQVLEKAPAGPWEKLKNSWEDVFSSLRYKDLASAVLLGSTQGIDPQLYGALQESQTQHLLSVSGLHISILLFSLERFLAILHLSLKKQGILFIGLTLFYMALLGFAPAVTRAGIMAVMGFLARCLRRNNDSFTSLLLAAAILVSENPLCLFELSFQLSFLSTLGIVKLYVPHSRMIRRKHSPASKKPLAALAKSLLFYVGECSLLTLSALLFSLPVLLLLSQEWNLWALAANLLLASIFTPLLTAVFLFFLLQAIFSLLHFQSLSAVISSLCDCFLRIFQRTALSLGQLSFPLPLASPLSLPLALQVSRTFLLGSTLSGEKHSTVPLALCLLLVPLLLLIQVFTG